MKDPRYKAIKSLIESKGIKGLADIFVIVPLSVVKQDLKINYNTLHRRVNNANTLTLKDIVGMALLFDVDPAELFKLALNDLQVSR